MAKNQAPFIDQLSFATPTDKLIGGNWGSADLVILVPLKQLVSPFKGPSKPEAC